MTEPPIPPAEFTNTEGASAFTSVPVATLESLRSRGGGPRFIKRGNAVHYSYAALREWMTDQETETPTD